jgi:hypothetical protein
VARLGWGKIFFVQDERFGLATDAQEDEERRPTCDELLLTFTLRLDLLESS